MLGININIHKLIFKAFDSGEEIDVNPESIPLELLINGKGKFVKFVIQIAYTPTHVEFAEFAIDFTLDEIIEYISDGVLHEACHQNQMN